MISRIFSKISFGKSGLFCVFWTQHLIQWANLRTQKTVRKLKTWPFQLWRSLGDLSLRSREKDYLRWSPKGSFTFFFLAGCCFWQVVACTLSFFFLIGFPVLKLFNLILSNLVYYFFRIYLKTLSMLHTSIRLDCF
jgi:Flp pilus assembly protein TadB